MGLRAFLTRLMTILNRFLLEAETRKLQQTSLLHWQLAWHSLKVNTLLILVRALCAGRQSSCLTLVTTACYRSGSLACDWAGSRGRCVSFGIPWCSCRTWCGEL